MNAPGKPESLGKRMIDGLSEILDALERGEPIENHCTVHYGHCPTGATYRIVPAENSCWTVLDAVSGKAVFADRTFPTREVAQAALHELHSSVSAEMSHTIANEPHATIAMSLPDVATETSRWLAGLAEADLTSWRPDQLRELQGDAASLAQRLARAVAQNETEDHP